MGQELFPTGKIVKSLKVSAKAGRTWILVALYFTSFGGFLALTVWLPTYWSIYHGLDIITAGIITAVCFSLLAAFIRVYGGYLSDKIGGEKTAITSFTMVLIGAGILIAARSLFPALIGVIFMGAGMGIANAAVFKLVAEYVPEAVGSASGLIGGLGAFGGFVVPPILGSFVDIFGAEGYAMGFVVYMLLAALSLSLYCAVAQEPRKLASLRIFFGHSSSDAYARANTSPCSLGRQE